MRWRTTSSCGRTATTTSRGGGHEGGQGGPAAVAHGLDDAGLHELPASNVSDNDSYTDLRRHADLVLYQGGMLRTTVRRQQLQNRIDALTVEEAENDIRLALVEAYMQALYASEAVEIAVNTRLHRPPAPPGGRAAKMETGPSPPIWTTCPCGACAPRPGRSWTRSAPQSGAGLPHLGRLPGGHRRAHDPSGAAPGRRGGGPLPRKIPGKGDAMKDKIVIKGARAHNLKKC